MQSKALKQELVDDYRKAGKIDRQYFETRKQWRDRVEYMRQWMVQAGDHTAENIEALIKAYEEGGTR